MHPRDERALWLARHVLRHEPALRSWLARRPVAGLEIDDIVQETYTRLSLAASLDDVQNPRSYFFRTAWSVVVSHVRRSRIVEFRSFAQFDSEAFVDDDPDPETIVSDRDELYRLGEAIAALPSGEREVFVLRRVQGLSQHEVAEQLRLSENTIEKRMGRAIRRLAEQFGRGGRRRSHASRKETEGLAERNAARDEPGD
jgi:RNA polymerase sigma-70 factor (ECF subfamily)